MQKYNRQTSLSSGAILWSSNSNNIDDKSGNDYAKSHGQAEKKEEFFMASNCPRTENFVRDCIPSVKFHKAREWQKTWPMPIEYFSDTKVEFHILVKLLLISFNKFIPSWSRPFNIEISWQRAWFICFRVLIRWILFMSPLLSSVILADFLLMNLISDQIFSNSFAKFMSIRLLYEGRYESRHRIGEDLSSLS